MSKKKKKAISIHQTLAASIKVNWDKEYKHEYNCPSCNQCKLKKHYSSKDGSVSGLYLYCDSCHKQTYLTCRVPAYIYQYRHNIECPNPLCTEIGNHGQKGWIYEIEANISKHRCRYCGINFNPYSQNNSGWVNCNKNNTTDFDFDDDIWDLSYFYKESNRQLITFNTVLPHWYQIKTKEYLYYLLKTNRYSSSTTIKNKASKLRQFSKIILRLQIEDHRDISREVILTYLDSKKTNDARTINQGLHNIQDFLEWLGLETKHLIRRRDFLKTSESDPSWLDEVTRKAIKRHLDKIPAPIACHYLIQAYIAARPDDVCRMAFNCLTEENNKWYINFLQHKTQRRHKILASRKIRKIIEEQQQWIREACGKEYSYLFCHFRVIRPSSYPDFPTIKPLPQPPKVSTQSNPMVRIIRMLIEKENVLDANGQKPHFTGRITRHSRLQEVRTKYGMEAAQLYADHKNSTTTFQHYAPPTREEIAEVDLPFQKLLLNPDNKFLPWQSLPESLLQNPKAHELDLEIAPRLVVYGHCALDPKTPCPINLFPKCYSCNSFRPSTAKLPLYKRQHQGEQQRLAEAETAGAELAHQEAKATIEAMDKWLPELRRLAND